MRKEWFGREVLAALALEILTVMNPMIPLRLLP
jgi:hypothetical protein